jgi:AcrR family transcriptional regulator
MPNKKDTEEKKREILYKVFDYILEFGIKEFSVSAFIKHYKIGKSSIYHYYKSKDEILHEMYYKLAMDDLAKTEKEVAVKDSLEDKLRVIFGFYLSTDPKDIKCQEIFLEYFSSYKSRDNELLLQYDKEVVEGFEKLIKTTIKDEIQKGTIKKEALDIADSLYATGDGMMMYSHTISEYNLSQEFGKYLETIIKLIKIEQ